LTADLKQKAPEKEDRGASTSTPLPQTYEDLLFNQLKNAKFVHPVVAPSVPAQAKETDDGWASFTSGASQKEPVGNVKDRFDLIHDAFAELI
jgi:hypothetical protein